MRKAKTTSKTVRKQQCFFSNLNYLSESFSILLRKLYFHPIHCVLIKLYWDNLEGKKQNKEARGKDNVVEENALLDRYSMMECLCSDMKKKFRSEAMKGRKRMS